MSEHAGVNGISIVEGAEWVGDLEWKLLGPSTGRSRNVSLHGLGHVRGGNGHGVGHAGLHMTRIVAALQLSESDSLGILLLRHTASQCENRVFCLCDIMLCSYLLWFI